MSQVRKVTVNLDAGLFADAQEIQRFLGHDTMSSLVERAIQEYITAHAIRLHRNWRDENGLNSPDAIAAERSLITEVLRDQ
jgi:hypothetical protein